MKKLLLTALIASTLIAPLNASEELEDNRYLYVMYKLDGTCQFLGSILDYENEVDIEGAEDYIDRIFKYQYESLGYKSELDFLLNCTTAGEVVSKSQKLTVEKLSKENISTALSASHITGYCTAVESASEVLSNDVDKAFLVDFLITELKKLEMDLHSFSDNCGLASSHYQTITEQE